MAICSYDLSVVSKFNIESKPPAIVTRARDSIYRTTRLHFPEERNDRCTEAFGSTPSTCFGFLSSLLLRDQLETNTFLKGQ
jgi:hypothetical protein